MLLSLLSLVVVTLAYPQTDTEGLNFLTVLSESTRELEDITTNVTERIKDESREKCRCVSYNFCDPHDVVDKSPESLLCEYSEVCCKTNKADESLEPTFHAPKVSRGCGYRNPQGVGSFPSKNSMNSGETPWVVALMVGNTTVGAGALVHPQVVLTAAHVSDKYLNTTLLVRAGEFHTKTDKQRFKPQERLVENVKIHKNFNKGSLKNDIALLYLQTPMELTEHINVICLPDQYESFDQSRGCITNGWRKDSSGAVTLKRVEADVISSESCNAKLKKTRLGKWFKLHNSFLCAEEKMGYTCQGDGGGPLVCPGEEYYKVCGLVAWGIGCGDDIPAVYARVSMFREWIDETVREFGFGDKEWI